MTPLEEIRAQVTAAAPQVARDGIRDAAAWSTDHLPTNPVAWARAIVREGLLGTYAPELDGGPEIVRTGDERTRATDCEDRVLRLGAAVLARFPRAVVSMRAVGNPPWHVVLIVDGQAVETLPARALPPAGGSATSRVIGGCGCGTSCAGYPVSRCSPAST